MTGIEVNFTQAPSLEGDYYSMAERIQMLRPIGVDPDFSSFPGSDVRFKKIRVKKNGVVAFVEVDGELRYCEKICRLSKARSSIDFDRLVASVLPDATCRLLGYELGDDFGILRYDFIPSLAKATEFSEMLRLAACINLVDFKSFDWIECEAGAYLAERNENYFDRRLIRFPNRVARLSRLLENDEFDLQEKEALVWLRRESKKILEWTLSIPRVVSHGDLHRRNVLNLGDRGILIDYDEWGLLPIGSDLGRLIFQYKLFDFSGEDGASLLEDYLTKLEIIASRGVLIKSAIVHAIAMNLGSVLLTPNLGNRKTILALVSALRDFSNGEF